MIELILNEKEYFKVAHVVNRKSDEYRRGQLTLCQRKRKWLRKQYHNAKTLQERMIIARLATKNLEKIDHLERLLQCGIYKISLAERKEAVNNAR